MRVLACLQANRAKIGDSLQQGLGQPRPVTAGSPNNLGRGEEALADSPGPPLPFSKPMWRVDTPKFFGTINQVSRWMSELGRSTSPRLTAKLSKPRCPPGGALLFGADRAAGWLAEPNVLKSDFDTLVGLEARAVTESETEAERLRAQARRALELARAINDPEAALRLNLRRGRERA